MRSLRHRLLALPLALAISLAAAASASAADFTMPGSVAPDQQFTVTPSLNAAELLDAQAVRFRFSDTQEISDETAPVNEAKTFPGYGTAGRKTVTMQVEYLVAPDEFVTHLIRVNAAPTAAFNRDVQIPNVGQSVRFDATPSSDDQENAAALGDGETATPLPNSAYEWDFDDNGTYEQVGLTVQRTFATPGEKPVTLRVTDAGGRRSTIEVVVHVNRPPVASFVFSPKAPRVGGRVEFTSVSDDPDDPIALVEWDLDGDGQYDDGRGNTAARVFTTVGNHTVRVRVRDTRGRIDTAAQTLIVSSAPPPNEPTKPLTKLRPWPRIRIVGFAGSSRVRLDLLTIRTTRGSTVKVRCKGKGCPRKTAVSTRARAALVRVRWLERRLPAGTRLYVAITRPGFIGRYERILLRRKKEPLRRTLCLYPGVSKPGKCR
jgi:PKD repeat protein